MITYKETVEILINWPRFRKRPGFKTVKELLKLMEYKEEVPMIHVVGTNGKGSVTAMLSSILQAHGLKVGRFTSPHLIDIRERITINGEQMTEETFVRYYEILRHGIEQYERDCGEVPTFFEVLFLMAVRYFADEKVDVMIMEAGIGGENDTTNVLENRWLNIITSISLDHGAILGDSLEAVAKEKSGIIRAGIKTVAWTENQEVARVIQASAEKNRGKLVAISSFDGNILERGKEAIDFSLRTKYYNYERLVVHGADYQLDNAAIAVTAIHELEGLIKIRPDLIRQGLEAFKWPGRMDYIYPWLLVDGGHNPAGIRRFVEHLNHYEKNRKIDLLFASMGDKDHRKMCRALLDIQGLGEIYLVKLPYDRAVDEREVIDTFQQMNFTRVHVIEHLFNFLDKRKSEVGARTLLGAVGSLYLVGEIMKYRGGHNSD